MRELKFRVWSEEDKEYRPDIKVSDLVIDIDGAPSTIYSDEGDRFDIEQYTGLKDKNGKEIYEGDIVKYAWTRCNYQITYRRWDASFVLENDNREEIICMVLKQESDYEVIGNIHENPELLEDEE